MHAIVIFKYDKGFLVTLQLNHVGRQVLGVMRRPNKEEGCESPANPSLCLGDRRFMMPLSKIGKAKRCDP